MVSRTLTGADIRRGDNRLRFIDGGSTGVVTLLLFSSSRDLLARFFFFLNACTIDDFCGDLNINANIYKVSILKSCKGVGHLLLLYW